MVVLYAGKFSPSFRAKTGTAQYAIIHRLLSTHGIVIRAKTHEAQQGPGQTEEKAMQFILSTRILLSGPHRHHYWIANMDQTPAYFSMVPRTTLNPMGERSVNVRSSSGSTMRVTVAVTVTASGDILAPYLVFKGKRGFLAIYPPPSRFTWLRPEWST